MVKISNENEYKIGDEVWWFDVYGNLKHDKVVQLTNLSYKNFRNKEDIKEYENIGTVPMVLVGCNQYVKRFKCWPTKEACLQAEVKRAKLQTAEYKESIKDVKDLVAFLFTHDVQSEHRDFEAEAAAKERAEELLDLKIE